MIARLAVALGLAATLVGASRAGDVPLAGNRALLIDRAHAAARHNRIGLLDPDLTGVDPTVDGATATIGRELTGAPVTFELPAGGWSVTARAGRRDFKFRSAAGPVRAARLVDGRSLRLSASGTAAYGLDGAAQGAVGVVVQIGDVRFCGLFGGTIVRDDGVAFAAHRAPAPATCPILGATTTSTEPPTTTTEPPTTTTTASTTTSEPTTTTALSTTTTTELPTTTTSTTEPPTTTTDTTSTTTTETTSTTTTTTITTTTSTTTTTLGCQLVCQFGGVLDAQACTCSCPPNFTGDQCQDYDCFAGNSDPSNCSTDYCGDPYNIGLCPQTCLCSIF